MTNDLGLASFVTSAAAHRRITFGDVRRLQRDYLPDGITTREQAEMLTALAPQIEHADRSWRQWFAAALADFATKSAGSEATTRDETIAWLEQLSKTPGMVKRISRKLARELRRGAELAEAPVIAAEETAVAAGVPQEAIAPSAEQHHDRDETERRKRTRAAKRSRIIVRRAPAKPTRPQRKLDAMPLAVMPTQWVWSPLMAAQHLQIQLAAPVL
ncbi:MAG TPA: hypothetical protein VGG01_10985 [Xanthobacteraceae bacterium]|jgi:hypothetical protein